MSETTRAVMEDLIDALKAKSSGYWEFKQDGENAVEVGKGLNLAIAVVATDNKVELWMEPEVLEGYISPAPPTIKNGQEVYLVPVCHGMSVGIRKKDGFWLHDFKPPKYEDRKQALLNLMLLTQARCLELMGV